MLLLKPSEYLQEAMGIIEAEAYYQPRIKKWNDIVARAYNRTTQVTTITEVHSIIREVLGALGDNHSHLYVPGEKKLKPTEYPTGKRVNNWGYITLPRAVGNDDEMQTYANLGHAVIRDIGETDGWIVDLRNNGGGNMWAMISVIGVIAGRGILGYFVNRDNQWSSWSYEAGGSYYQQDVSDETQLPEVIYSVDTPVPSIVNDCPVAVLMGKSTGSSGEATLISFLGRANTLTFGQPSRGIPTANATFSLPDDSLLVVTQALMADRLKQTYEDSIVPDVICDDAMATSIEWLSKS